MCVFYVLMLCAVPKNNIYSDRRRLVAIVWFPLEAEKKKQEHAGHIHVMDVHIPYLKTIYRIRKRSSLHRCIICSVARTTKFETILALKLQLVRIRPTKAMSLNPAANESPRLSPRARSPRIGGSPRAPSSPRAPVSVRLDNITQMSPSAMKDRYKNLRCWGAGAYGKVFRAFDRKKARNVAIKYIGVNAQAEISDKLMKSLKTEISILTKCAKESRYITRLYNTYHNHENEQFDCFWIVMEFCDFGSLKDLIDILIAENTILAEEQIAMIVASVLKGLICLHKNCIIHRDIKPGNILLTSGGWCKLADFGVSAEMGRQKDDMRRTFAGP